ncbi:MAG TPA: T9SS type A sorting domain-containing protein [Acidobacteriota bacterium]|nr:T9SS type A sorting domain-containing protein [Acidobacteriota bacterium]
MKCLRPLLAVLVVASSALPAGATAFPYFIDFTVKGDRPGQPTDPVNGSLTSYGFFSFDSSLIPPGGGDLWGEVRNGPRGTEILGLGATSLQFTWDSHTWTTEDADLFQIHFDTNGNCLVWSIGGNTVALNIISAGSYPDFWVTGARGGMDFKYSTANSLRLFRIFDGTLTAWRQSFGAKAFVESSMRTLPVGPSGPELRVWIEPIERAFDISDIDPLSLELSGPELGSVSIRPTASKPLLLSDRDHNGVADLGLSFRGEDVYRLSGGTVGRRVAPMVVRGQLLDGHFVRAEVDVNVVGTGPTLRVNVSPNPLNPTGTLSFQTSGAAPARIQVFSASGSLVQTLLDVSTLPPGLHEIRLGAAARNDRPLATGVYFYRVQADGKEAHGRLVVLK